MKAGMCPSIRAALRMGGSRTAAGPRRKSRRRLALRRERLVLAGLLAVLGWLAFAGASEAAPAAVEGGIRFTYVDPAATSVFLAGSFNGWAAAALPMLREGDVWAVVVPLEPGKHEYKFVVDGQWIADPANTVTVGEYGNSALTVASDGTLMAMQATSNTALSPKLWIGGRLIGLYLSEQNSLRGDRYELRRPRLDLDLDIRARINEELEAHVLANIGNEAENVELYQTRANFDRGSLTLDNPAIFLKAWDNEAVGVWDDPLHLVGDIGIYHHQFGYETVGAKVRKRLADFDGELIYADNSEAGGTEHPPVDLTGLTSRDHTVVVDGPEGSYLALGSPRILSYLQSKTDNDMDVLGLRVKRPVALGERKVRLGVSYRLNRGFNPGALAVVERDESDTTGTHGQLLEYASAFERSQAWGADAVVELFPGATLAAEYLRGTLRIETASGMATPVELVTTADGDSLTGELSRTGDAVEVGTSDLDLDLDQSSRAWVGLAWEKGLLGAAWSAAWEYQNHDFDELATSAGRDIENRVSVWHAGFRHPQVKLPFVERSTEARLDLEYHDFDYDPQAPWETQFWFDTRNFWLEQDEHAVAYERMTLLGGRDALLWHPGLRLRLCPAREVDFSYRAALGSEGWNRAPKFWESIFVLEGRLAPAWRFYIDARLARYDDPVLQLDESFGSGFVEISYRPAEGVDLALSYGVDPFVIDEPVNEYAYIGRDLFLFDQGAGAGAAETGFRGLGRLIHKAEQALEDERRVQLEAVLRF